MADKRFFANFGPFSLKDIISWTGCELLSESKDVLQNKYLDVSPLDRASAEKISFFDNSKYLEQFSQSQAGACFVRRKFVDKAPASMIVLVSDDPYRSYAMTAQHFYPRKSPVADISPAATISESAKIAEGCRVEAGVVIGENVSIGAGSIIGANSVIHEGVIIGEETQIGACSTISHAMIGNRCILHRGVHIGQDGFGFSLGRGGHVKVPQLGRVMIEEDVEIGSGTCIDRGTGPDTLVGAGSKIDNLVQIGHNAQIGRGVVIVAQAGIAGSTRIGDGCVIGGQVGIAGHLRIGAGTRIAAQSGLIADTTPGESVGGSPAVAIKDWHRQTIALSRLAKKPRE